jgi:hypothetical protein
MMRLIQSLGDMQQDRDATKQPPQTSMLPMGSPFVQAGQAGGGGGGGGARGGLDSIAQGASQIAASLGQIESGLGGGGGFQGMPQLMMKGGGIATTYGKKMSASDCKVSTGEKKSKSNSNW